MTIRKSPFIDPTQQQQEQQFLQEVQRQRLGQGLQQQQKQQQEVQLQQLERQLQDYRLESEQIPVERVTTMASANPAPVNTTMVPSGGVGNAQIPEKLIKPWKMGTPNKYIFLNANVVDVVKGDIIYGATVTIKDGHIASVDHSSPPNSPKLNNQMDATTVDLKGRFICPGLFDSHVHLTSTAGFSSLMQGGLGEDLKESYFRQPYLVGQILARGFTSLRDCGGATLALKEAIADDVFPGPRLFIANKALSQTGGHGDGRGPHQIKQCCGGGDTGLTEVADGVPAVLLAARTQLRTGADFIKIMVGGGVASPSDKLDSRQFTPDELRAISDVAEGAGTWVTAHAYTPAAIQHAVRNGIKGIEHGNMIDQETAELMAKEGVWLTPTLVTYDALGSAKYTGFLPPASQDKNRQVLKQGLESLQIASEAGVKICLGTDLLGPLHAEQSREFTIRKQVLSNADILRSATVTPAEMYRQGDILGQIKEGFLADLLILKKNPLEDISILDNPKENILSVLKNGRVYSSRWEGLPTDVEQPARL